MGIVTANTLNKRNIFRSGLLPNVQIKIVDLETGMTCGPNKVGEIYVKTPTSMIGYYKNAIATEKAFDDKGTQIYFNFSDL